MNKNKKTLKVITIWMMVLIMLVGCSSGNNNAGSNAKEESSSSKNQSQENSSSTQVKPNLKMLGFSIAIDPNTDPVADAIKERTGYDIEFATLPSDNPDEKLNIEIASGTDYDILALNPRQFNTLVTQGALQPIDEIVEQYGVNMKEAISDSSWDLARYNGKLYGVPQKNERANIERTIVVRQDILDELSLSMPTTLDELYTTLKTIKDKKPDMIPLTGNGMDIFMIYSAFGLYTDWAEENGQLVPRYKQERFKEYIQFMKKLYDEGLLDKDWAVNQTTQMQEKFVSGKAAMIQSNWNGASGMNAAFTTNLPNGKMAYMSPLKGANGEYGVQKEDKLLYVHAIPKTSKKAEDAIKFMDAKLEMETFTYVTLGTEGETFTVDNGAYSPIMPIFTELRGNAYWFLNGIQEVEYAEMWLARLRRTPTLFEAFNAINANFDEVAKANPIAFMIPIEEVGKYQSSLSQMATDFFVKVLLGNPVDDYDKFIQDWDAAGGKEMVDAVNVWYQTTK
jgi:putative aldouronate transport system substrate-binding protein